MLIHPAMNWKSYITVSHLKDILDNKEAYFINILLSSPIYGHPLTCPGVHCGWAALVASFHSRNSDAIFCRWEKVWGAKIKRTLRQGHALTIKICIFAWVDWVSATVMGSNASRCETDTDSQVNSEAKWHGLERENESNWGAIRLRAASIAETPPNNTGTFSLAGHALCCCVALQRKTSQLTLCFWQPFNMPRGTTSVSTNTISGLSAKCWLWETGTADTTFSASSEHARLCSLMTIKRKPTTREKKEQDVYEELRALMIKPSERNRKDVWSSVVYLWE